MRVPLPLKPQIERAKERYDNFIENGGDPNNPPDIQKLFDCFNDLEVYISQNIPKCNQTNICPNWGGTLLIVRQIQELLTKFS